MEYGGVGGPHSQESNTYIFSSVTTHVSTSSLFQAHISQTSRALTRESITLPRRPVTRSGSSEPREGDEKPARGSDRETLVSLPPSRGPPNKRRRSIEAKRMR